MDYGLDDWGSIPGGGRNYFSLLYCIHTGSKAHPASYPMGNDGYFPEGKMAGA
jgi:hypothetical protein